MQLCHGVQERSGAFMHVSINSEWKQEMGSNWEGKLLIVLMCIHKI